MRRAVGSWSVLVSPRQSLHQPFETASAWLASAPMRDDGCQLFAIAANGHDRAAMHPAAIMTAHPDGFAALPRGTRNRNAAQFRRPVQKWAFPKSPALRQISHSRHATLYHAAGPCLHPPRPTQDKLRTRTTGEARRKQRGVHLGPTAVPAATMSKTGKTARLIRAPAPTRRQATDHTQGGGQRLRIEAS